VIASLRRIVVRPRVWLLLEMVIIAAWAFSLGRGLLEFDEYRIPTGMDYSDNVQGNFVWEQVRECGTCALWNGDLNGGAPAFADSISPLLHPVVIVATLWWGVIDGSKVVIVLALLIGGLGQLWIGYGLGVGRFARVTAAMIAVGAGHLTGPLESGLLAITLATAAATVVIASLLHLVNRPSRRSAAFLALALASFVLAGQGYIQVGLALLSPIAAVLLMGRKPAAWSPLVERGIAVFWMTALLTAPLIVPFLHVYSRVGKETDPEFRAAQPWQYVPLNLVMDDWNLYHSEMLGLKPYPGWYMNYVGWIPVGLAIVGIVALWRRRPHVAGFFVLMIAGAMFLASAVPLRAAYDLFDFAPAVREAVASLRNIQLVARLAVIPLLGLTAVGIDAAWRWRPPAGAWKGVVRIGRSAARRIRVRPDLRPVILVLVVIAIVDIRSFGQQWIQLVDVDRDDVAAVLTPLATEERQWVQPPLGERWHSLYIRSFDLKVANMWRPWHLSYRDYPPPYLEVTRGGEPLYPYTELAPPAEGLRLFSATESPAYTTFQGDPAQSTCVASGSGGAIGFVCEAETAGWIQILENDLPGWTASVDGKATDVRSNGQWLAVDIPAGTSKIELRYRPWDVWVGLGLALIGLVWAAVWIVPVRPPRVRSIDRFRRFREPAYPPDFVPYEP
jgi:hypothetical protein